tara:strand:+ start:351 stop:746 length:396 start_codon:yes stop_codon:yes gene_type:complete
MSNQIGQTILIKPSLAHANSLDQQRQERFVIMTEPQHNRWGIVMKVLSCQSAEEYILQQTFEGCDHYYDIIDNEGWDVNDIYNTIGAEGRWAHLSLHRSNEDLQSFDPRYNPYADDIPTNFINADIEVDAA